MNATLAHDNCSRKIVDRARLSENPALDRDRKAFGRFALGIFECADVKARRTRFDRGHSHGFSALEARQNSNFRAAE